jgi:hypothetical protein
LRFFFGLNIVLWCVLFTAWLAYVEMMGPADPVSVQVAFILGIAAALLLILGYMRWRRRRGLRVSA